LRVNGDSIFDTRGGPYEPGMWGGSTRRGNKVFLHLTELAQDGRYTLPPLPSKIRSWRMLSGAKVDVSQTKDSVVIAMAPSLATDSEVVDRVVELEIADDAWEMLPEGLIPVEEAKPLSVVASASSENTYKRPSGKSVTESAANLATGEGGGWSASEPWSEAGLDPDPWLMFDLGKVKPLQRVFVQERHSRIMKYILEYKESASGDWKTIVSGGRLNYLSYRMAQPISTQYVRIRFVEMSGGAPQINLFHLYGT